MDTAQSVINADGQTLSCKGQSGRRRRTGWNCGRESCVVEYEKKGRRSLFTSKSTRSRCFLVRYARFRTMTLCQPHGSVA